MITVFECPFREDCHEERVVSWIENEPMELIFPIKCRAPFLINRKNGQYICRIIIEDDKKANWIEAIDEIGRAKRKSDKRKRVKVKKVNKRTRKRTKAL